MGLSGGGLLNWLVELDGLGKVAGLFAPVSLLGRLLFMGWDAGIIMVKMLVGGQIYESFDAEWKL